MISIKNNGPEITETDYFTTDHARQGYCAVSLNAGTMRLLVPDSMRDQIQEMATGKYVICTRGYLDGKLAFEFLFEDFSDSPFCLHIDAKQFLSGLPNREWEKGGVFSVWTRGPKKHFQCELKYRLARELPHLEPWDA